MESLDIPCPGCGHAPVIYTMTQTDVAFFGPMAETLLLCPRCGFKHSDTILLEQRAPLRFTLLIEGEADMSVRVVRSASCTVRIPELGVTIEPGPIAESYVSNVEGVLVRVERVVNYLRRDAESEPRRKKADKLLQRLAHLRTGKDRATLILEDPCGNSLVLSEKAKKETLTAEEASHLKMGMTIMEMGGTVTKEGDKRPPKGRPLRP
jgi:zinc finger protein